MQREKYLVSLILPVFNVDKFLSRCIESTMGQTYKNIEIILVNDGSTDSSKEIAEEYAKKDNRIKVIDIPNQGVSVARNIGIDNSKGEFISFIDSDDLISEDFVEYMLTIYEVTQADLCMSLNNFTTKDDKQIFNDTIKILSSEEAVAELLYPRIRMGVWNKLWKTSFIKEHNFRFIPGQHTAEGLTFMTNAAQYANRVGLGCRKVYCYRLDNETSATTKADVKRHGIGSLKAMDLIESNINMESDLIRNAMNYQRWSTSTFALRQIIDSKSKNDYYGLYKELISYIRKNSLKMLDRKINLPIRMRIIAVCRWINPVWITKMSLYLRNRHLKKNK